MVYEKPIATFKVLPGEIVDIGSLRLPGGVARDGDGRRKDAFIGVVTPTPDAVLKALAEKDPDFTGAASRVRWRRRSTSESSQAVTPRDRPATRGALTRAGRRRHWR